jgi:hypothetical protein
MAENTAGKQRGKPFRKGQSGNPAGKPKGTKHMATRVAEALLDGEAERITRKAIERALEGDTTALRLCLERLIPARRDRPITFELPPVETAADAAKAIGSVLTAVAAGEVTPQEAAEVASLIETYAKALEIRDLESRIATLEQKVKDNGPTTSR